MSELLPLSQVDVAVHFNYMRRSNPHSKMHSEASARFERVERRVETVLAPNPQAVMLYYSAYLHPENGLLLPDAYRAGTPAFKDDVARIESYRAALGNRLLVLGCDEIPSRTRLAGFLQDQGLVARPDSKLLSYGEWLSLCVGAYRTYTLLALGINYENGTDDPSLSLDLPNDKSYF